MKQVVGKDLESCVINDQEILFRYINNTVVTNKLYNGRLIKCPIGEAIIRGGITTDNNYLQHFDKTKCDRLVVEYFDKKLEKSKYQTYELPNIESDTRNINFDWFYKSVPITITDCQLTAKAFGLLKTKSALVGKTYTDYKISRGNCKWLGEQETYYIEIPHEGNLIKFVIADVKFNMPLLQGYNPPKNKQFKIGRAVYKKGKREKVYTILSINQNKSVRRRNGLVNKMDLITIQGESGITQQVYKKSLKLVN